MPIMRNSVHPNYFKIMHVSFGIFVFIFAIKLFFMRFYKPVARPETDASGWLIKLVTIGTHYLLYAFLVAIPFSGWIAASIRGKAISFLGLFDVPLLTVSDPSFLHSFGKMHSRLAVAIGVIAMAHLSAALYHHFVLKDEVLNRMRPKR